MRRNTTHYCGLQSLPVFTYKCYSFEFTEERVRQKHVDLCEFQAILVYKIGFRPVRAS